MKTRHKTTFFISLLLSMTSLSAHALTPDQMVKKADLYRSPETSYAYLAIVTEFDDATQLRETKYAIAYQPADKIRVETKFPSRSVGRNMLMVGRDMWVQTPDVGRPTRISFQQKLTGEVANGDIARTNFSADYNAQFVSEEKVLSRKTKKLLLKAKSKDVTYAAIYYWIEIGTHKPVKAEFLTSDLKVMKRGFFKRPKKVFNTTLLTELELTDALSSRRSVLTYKDFRKTKFKPSSFNKDALRENEL